LSRRRTAARVARRWRAGAVASAFVLAVSLVQVRGAHGAEPEADPAAEPSVDLLLYLAEFSDGEGGTIDPVALESVVPQDAGAPTIARPPAKPIPVSKPDAPGKPAKRTDPNDPH